MKSLSLAYSTHFLKTAVRGIAAGALFTASTAWAAGKHVHGEAELFIAVNQQQVLIELETPAANIVGFEHKPKTHQQKQIIKNALAKLEDYRNIVNLEGDISCSVNNVSIQSPFETTDDH
ncbi:ZrgA family zinc uptake protein, partial [Eionea flava]